MSIVIAVIAVLAAGLVAWVASLEMRVQGLPGWAESKFARRRRSRKEA
jgi:hypothetical protein